MKKVRVEDAVGMVLGHDVTKIVPEEFKGAAFKKGHIITEQDIDVLKSMGKNNINIVELESGMIHEDDAATRIAGACAGDNIHFTGPSEGKIELVSDVRGIVSINIEALQEINSIDEVILATIHNNTLVEKNSPIAATRVIPLAINEKSIIRVEEIGNSNRGIVSVKGLKPLKVGVVISGTEVYEGRIKDRFAPIMTEKIKHYGCALSEIKYAPDDLLMLEKQIMSLIEEGSDVVLACGGMSVDADDVTPQAIKNTSDNVVSYGIPALPGNMLMLAYKGKTAIFGIPAAAIFYKTTTLDLLLPRILTGEVLSKRDLASYGHGGYCFKCDICLFPNCPFGK